jgi:glycosyltransferase involved in cell wall biosynthesis
MGRLRICQIITELRPAGAERAVYELSTRLDRGLFDAHVVALRGGEVAGWLQRAGVSVTVLGVRGKWDMGKFFQLAALLRQGGFDLVHTHLFHADLAGRPAARRAGVPHLVHTEHIAEMRFRPWQFAWARLSDRWCDKIICCSAGVRDHHARKSRLDRSRYTVIYNGIDVPAYARNQDRRAQLRRDWQIPPGQAVLAWVARLDRQKNVELFLSALAQLRRGRQDFRVVMAGEGRQRPRVEAFLARGDNARWVRLLGYTQDVPGVLSAADLFVLPSRWEGLPLVAAEAMAAGLAVVATRVPGLAEAVDDGRTGILVESENLDQLVGAVARLLDDAPLRDALGRAGLRRVNDMFSIQANVQAHQQLYLETVNR